MSHESARYDKVFSRLQGVRQCGRRWQALCPIHEADGQRHRPSLDLRIGDSGSLVVKCWVCGCSFDDIVAALNLEVGDFCVDQEKFKPMANNDIIATYEYCNENGVLLYEVVRFSDKRFLPRRKHGEHWAWGLNAGKYATRRDGSLVRAKPEDEASAIELPECRRVLYKLPELLASDPKLATFVVEGDRDVDRLLALNISATCNPNGAGKWSPSYSQCLRGRPVIVVADNDNPGREHAKAVCDSLLGVAGSVKYLELPGVPEKGDISDYLGAGHTKDDLRELVKKLPVLTEKFTVVSEPQREAVAVQSATNGQRPVAQAAAKADPGAVRRIVDEAKALGRDKMIVIVQFLLSELAVEVADSGR